MLGGVVVSHAKALIIQASTGKAYRPGDRLDFQASRIHSARKSRSGFAASFFMILLISALSNSAISPASSKTDSWTMR